MLQSEARQYQKRSCGSWRAESDADALPDPAGREELARESTMEGMQPHLSLAVIGESSGLVVQQHADTQGLRLQLPGHRLPASGVPGAQLPLVQLEAPRQLVHSQHACLALLLARDGLICHPDIRPRLGHLQLPVVPAVREVLKAQHLPGVVKTGLVSRNGPRPRGQVLRPPVTVREEEVGVGRTRVKSQGTAVCEEEEIKI